MKRSPQRKAALRRTASTSARLQDRNRKKRRNFFLEKLEDRSLMAAIIWQGGSGTELGTPANWVGGIAPQQDDSLIFPVSANYSIAGANAITLLEGVTFNGATGAASVTIPLSLGAAASFYSANVGQTLTLGQLDLGIGNTLTTDGKGNINA